MSHIAFLFAASLFVSHDPALGMEERRETVVVTGSGPAVCVIDSAAPGGLRPADTIVERLGRDSVRLRDGSLARLSRLKPAVLGFAADPGGLPQRPGESYSQVLGHRYEPFGPPRMIPGFALLAAIGEVGGVSVFAERGMDIADPPGVLYVLKPDCRFQAYKIMRGLLGP